MISPVVGDSVVRDSVVRDSVVRDSVVRDSVVRDSVVRGFIPDGLRSGPSFYLNKRTAAQSIGDKSPHHKV